MEIAGRPFDYHSHEQEELRRTSLNVKHFTDGQARVR
jgi:hypothetical protein